MVQSLLYVGMSRARALLILVAHEEARKSIDARIKAARAGESNTGRTDPRSRHGDDSESTLRARSEFIERFHPHSPEGNRTCHPPYSRG